MKKLLVLFVGFMFIFTLAACSSTDGSVDDETTYAAIDINPSIELLLDDEKIVISVNYLNEDAEVVAADLDLVGLPFNEALELYLQSAIETGYIDVDSNENIVTVTSSDDADEEQMKDDVEAVLAERGIGAAIFGGEMNEEYEALAEEYNIGVGRARLISRAVEIDGSMTFEEALDLSHEEIMTILIDEHRANMDAFIEEKRAEATEMKEGMEAEASTRVEEHRADVEAGNVETPDYDAIRGNVEANIDAIRSAYQNRINEARQKAQERIDDANINEMTSYSSIDINPSIEFILDEDRIVISVNYLNEDAEIVAADLNLVGLPFNEALELYITAAIETGYLDVDSDENVITVTNDDTENEEAIKDDIETILADKGIGAAIFGGEMNEEYEALAEEYDISVGRARLISRAVEIDGSMTFEEALDLSHEEIMKILIDEHRANMNAFIEEKKSEAMAIKEEMRAQAMARVEEHRNNVESGNVETPDYDAIRDDVETDLEAIRKAYQERINKARDKAEVQMPNRNQ